MLLYLCKLMDILLQSYSGSSCWFLKGLGHEDLRTFQCQWTHISSMTHQTPKTGVRRITVQFTHFSPWSLGMDPSLVPTRTSSRPLQENLASPTGPSAQVLWTKLHIRDCSLTSPSKAASHCFPLYSTSFLLEGCWV